MDQLRLKLTQSPTGVGVEVGTELGNINLEDVEIMVIEQEVSELVEDTHSDVWLNLKQSTKCI